MFTLPELAFKYDALEPYIDRETMHIHHDKHHATYVKNLNDLLINYPNFLNLRVEEVLMSAAKLPVNIRQKVINNGGGVINHNMFWTIMSPDSGSPGGKLLLEINSVFGNFDKFKEQFTKSALGRFGSGWVWLVIENNKLNIIDTLNQDTVIGSQKKPILTLDVWEHAYYLKYQNRRADYISAWWNIVNWKQVEKIYSET